MPFHGEADVGWAGAYTPMIVSEDVLNELRNLAGPPSYPGQKWIMVDLMNGEFKWATRARKTAYRSRRRK